MRRLARLLVATVAVGLGACADKPEPKPTTPVVRPVRVDKVELRGGPVTRTFSGAARAGTEARLSFKVGGTLSKLRVKVGDQVKKGDLIATVEAGDFRIQAGEAKAAVAQARAQARNADSSYQRVKALYENNNATQADLEAARSQRESARASVDAAKKRAELASSQTGDTRLTAPVAGVIAEVPVERNENVNPGQVIAVLNAGGLPEVEISVPESLIGDFKRGAPATVMFDAIPGESFTAKVTEVGVAAAHSTTTFRVIATLDTEDKRVRPGIAAEVTSTLGDPGGEKKLYVRAKAVGEDDAGRFAFVAVPTSAGMAKVQRRKLEVGELGARGLEVVSGLSEGELLITAGLTYLADGMEVRLPEASADSKAVTKKPEPSELPPPPDGKADGKADGDPKPESPSKAG